MISIRVSSVEGNQKHCLIELESISAFLLPAPVFSIDARSDTNRLEALHAMLLLHALLLSLKAANAKNVKLRIHTIGCIGQIQIIQLVGRSQDCRILVFGARTRMMITLKYLPYNNVAVHGKVRSLAKNIGSMRLEQVATVAG